MPDSRKFMPLLLASVIACAAANADTYRFEVGLSAEHASLDVDELEPGDADLDVIGVTGTYYLAPVPTDGIPLAEAAFLNHSSFVAAAAVRSELDDEKIDILGASFGYYVPGTMFYGRIGVNYLDDYAGDQTQFNGTFGITPFDGLLVTTEFDEDGWDPNATARYVGKLGNGNFYAASVSAVDPDGDDLEFGLGFDYYFDHTFSVGAGVGDERVSLRAEKFFTPRFAVAGRVYDADDGDGFGASVRWRF
jgi:hypothetical protein